jgi:pyruvate dehydrogenase kinase 2/3/4
MTWRASKELMTQIHHFASFPQTSVSLQQMVQFGMPSSQDHMPMTPGSEPSPGTLLRASQFLAGTFSIPRATDI